MNKIFDIYKNPASTYLEYIDTEIERRNFRCVRDMIIKSGKEKLNIVDLCCGPFPFVYYLNEILITGKSIKYVGVDINEAFIQEAKKKANFFQQYNLPKERFDIQFIQGDVLETRVEKQANIVLSTSSFHHIENKERYVQLVKSILSPEGQWVIYEKFVRKGNSIRAGMEFYAARILDILKEQKLTSEQAFGLANEMYLTAIRDQEYKISLSEFYKLTKDFTVSEKVKLWPKNKTFDDSDIGDYVMVLKNRK